MAYVILLCYNNKRHSYYQQQPGLYVNVFPDCASGYYCQHFISVSVRQTLFSPRIQLHHLSDSDADLAQLIEVQ